MVKSPKTGAYIFQEEMIPNEAVKRLFREITFLIKDIERGSSI